MCLWESINGMTMKGKDFLNGHKSSCFLLFSLFLSRPSSDKETLKLLPSSLLLQPLKVSGLRIVLANRRQGKRWCPCPELRTHRALSVSFHFLGIPLLDMWTSWPLEDEKPCSAETSHPRWGSSGLTSPSVDLAADHRCMRVSPVKSKSPKLSPV